MPRWFALPLLLIGSCLSSTTGASAAQPGSSPSGPGAVVAMYATRAEAEAAAPTFGCKGAHRMGSHWMPCALHPAAGDGTTHPAAGH